MGEIAVFGGTAHPALAAEIRADLGVRCAASQASSASWRRDSARNWSSLLRPNGSYRST